jgi:hypothetical protein
VQGKLAPVSGNACAVCDGATVGHVCAAAGFFEETVDEAQGGSAGEPRCGVSGVEFSCPLAKDRGYWGGRERWPLC